MKLEDPVLAGGDFQHAAASRCRQIFLQLRQPAGKVNAKNTQIGRLISRPGWKVPHVRQIGDEDIVAVTILQHDRLARIEQGKHDRIVQLTLVSI